MSAIDSSSSSSRSSSNGVGREHFMRKAPHSTKSSSGNADSEWDSTQKSLREALAANRELQEKILSELARIARRKRDNRLEAERCIERSCAVVLAGETTGSTAILSSTTTGAESGSKQGSTENEGIPKDDDVANNKKTAMRRKRKKNIKGSFDYVPTNKDINELLAGDGNCDSDKDTDEHTEGNKIGVEKVHKKEKTEKRWSLYLRKKFRYDQYRKWTSEYFIDPTGSRPKENEDTIRRRKLMMKKKKIEFRSTSGQQQKEYEMVPDTFFYHTSQPFTSQEKSRLDKWLLQGNNNNKWIGGGDDDSDAFYEAIAQKLRQEHHENPAVRKKDKVLLSTCVPRSAEAIRLYHLHRLASQYEFTKEESLAILEGVEETTGASTAHRGTVQEKESEESTQMNNDDHKESNTDRIRNQATMRPDWQKICNRVLEVHQRENLSEGNINQGVVNGVPPITPYQCMVHYKTKLRSQPDGSFTPEEDELLLRYIAAMGPQFVWGYPQITDLASRLFPHKTSRRIYERTHFSQWHPLSKDTIWTKEEEQKLVLAMKIYSETGSEGHGTFDDDNDDNGIKTGGKEISEEERSQNMQRARLASEKAALRKAAAHFHPYRQPYKVAKKWERSFSPRFSYKPFSKDEDARLLAAVRSSAVTTPFSEIAKKNFPDRSSDQLSQRWTKIAPDKDVVKKFVPSMVRSGFKRGLLSTKSGIISVSPGEATNSEGDNGNNTVQNRSGALFDPSDFVVEVLANKAQDGQI